jgi:ribA/ribD-fused uncharacterized protein
MVVSVINNSISYTEVKSVDDQDVDFTTSMFIVELHDQTCLIALGKLNKTYGSKGIYYIPIYLVNGIEVISKIGLFEFEMENEVTMYDVDRDFNLEKFDEPLLFGFVTKAYIMDKIKSLNIPELDEGYVEEEKEEEEDVEKMSTQSSKSDLNFPFPDDTENLADVHNEEESKIEKENYDETNTTYWIQKFMKNMNYDIETVPGNGDCFFTTVRESFLGIPMSVKVNELRNILVDHVDEKTYQTRIERYNMFGEELKKANVAFKEAEKLYKKKKKNAMDGFNEKKKASEDKSISQQDKLKLVAEAKQIQSTWKTEKKVLSADKEKKAEQFEIVKNNLSEFKIMKNVNSIEEFKEVIKTNTFWADEWAIKKLESLLNIKFIVLSKENFESGDVGNVLNCGGEFSDYVKEKGAFRPAYYIIMSYKDNNHFDLVKFKDRRIFKYNELPYDIKQLIREKCMETSKNSEWNFIPKFKSGVEKKDEGQSKEVEEDPDKEIEEKQSVRSDESNKKAYDNLYKDNVVFQFYSKSQHKKPGKGSGETIAPERVKDFTDLQLKENKDWRKVLSNFYVAEFQLDGKRWNSVEHYFHANKFKTKDPNYYNSFSLDDKESKINKDPLLAKKAGRKLKLNSEEKANWEKVKSGIMKKAQMEKYRTNEYARKILLLTKDAKLIHYLGRGSGVVEFTETMEIRKELMNK